MVEEIHKNDIGTKFLVTIKDGTTAEDVSSATTKELIFKKPGETTVTQTATFESDGSDGKIYYISIADDLNEIGTWNLQARIVMPTGTFKTDISNFKVYDNLS